MDRMLMPFRWAPTITLTPHAWNYVESERFVANNWAEYSINE